MSQGYTVKYIDVDNHSDTEWFPPSPPPYDVTKKLRREDIFLNGVFDFYNHILFIIIPELMLQVLYCHYQYHFFCQTDFSGFSFFSFLYYFTKE